MNFAEAKKAVYDAAHKNGKLVRISSNKDRELLAQSLLNDSDYDFVTVESSSDPNKTKSVKPGKEIRDSLVSSFRKLGMDKDDAIEAASKIEFSKDFAKATLDVVDCTDIEYMKAGRSKKFPVTSTAAAQTSIFIDEVPEKKVASKSVVDDPVTGKKTLKPNGKFSVTEKHDIIKVKNKTPKWCKKKKG